VRFSEQDEFARADGAVERDRIDWDNSFVLIFIFIVFFVVFFSAGGSGGITRQFAFFGHLGGANLQWSAEYHELHRPPVANR
jgi:hypothetical protein